MITTDRHTTSKAVMPTLAQGLGNGCAARTPLRSAVGVYLDHSPTSFCRFVREFGQETTPTSIVNGPGQHATGQPLDVQVFHCNQIEAVDQLPGDLVLKVRPLISNMLMYPPQRT